MSAVLDVTRIYPHSQHRVWRALADPRAMAGWLGAEGFVAEKDHLFSVRGPAGPDHDGRAQCTVREIHAPTDLVLAWQAGPVQGEVRFTLEVVPEGTRLTVRQTGFTDPAMRIDPAALAALEPLIRPTPLWPLYAAGAAIILCGIGWQVAGASSPPPPAVEPVAAPMAREPAPVIHERNLPVHPDVGQSDGRPLRLGLPGPARRVTLEFGLHPLAERSDFDSVHSAIYDPLFERDGDRWTSTVAERWAVGTAGIDIWLHPGIRWHDGQALDAEDICFSVGLLAQDRIASCDADTLDPLHAMVVFKEPHPAPPSLLSGPLLPQHHAEAISDPFGPMASRPVGTGPYRAALGDDTVHLSAFDNPHHRAHIREVEISASDAFVTMRRLSKAELDVVLDVSGATFAHTIRTDPTFETVDLTPWEPGQELALWFSRDGALSDSKLRAALAQGFDRQAVRTSVEGSYGGRVVSVPGGLKAGPADATAFEQAMSDAGYERVQGVWERDGIPVTLTVGMAQSTPARSPRGLAEAVTTAVESLGFTAAPASSDADILIASIPVGESDRAVMLREANPFDIEDPELDQLIAEHVAHSSRASELTVQLHALQHGHVLGLYSQRRWSASWPEVELGELGPKPLRSLEHWRWRE